MFCDVHGTADYCPDCLGHIHEKAMEAAKARIDELEAKLDASETELAIRTRSANEAMAEVERLSQERDLIARFIHDDPPFDVCAEIDLHERAAAYMTSQDTDTPDKEDYYRAFLDCCKAALSGEGE